MVQACVFDEKSTEKFAEVAVSHRSSEFRFALVILRNRDAAEDLTQDCLLRAHQAWERFRGDCSPQTWLLAIANNLIRDARRRPLPEYHRTAQKRPSVGMDSSIPDSRSSPERQLFAKQQVGAMWRVMAEDLSPNQRRIFLLRFVKDMNILCSWQARQ